MASKAKTLVALLMGLMLPVQVASAACGVTDRTWDADNGNNRWDQDPNWSSDNRPDTTTENAIVVSAPRPCRMRETVSIGCLEVQSGRLLCHNGRTLTVTGDYFRNNIQGSLECPVGRTWRLDMAGTGDQTLENYDSFGNLDISNENTVTFTNPFEVRDSFNLNGSTTTVVIQDDFTFSDSTVTITIPSGNTIEIEGGETTFAGGLTVNGTLIIGAGATLTIPNGETLQVNSGGRIEFNGASGNVATLDSDGGGSSFTFNMAGIIDANYFRISRTDAAGVNITGTIAQMDNGEFHNIAASGYAFTLGAAASVPATLDTIGFFNDDGNSGTNNIDATLYNVANFTVDNYSGDEGGPTNETDPNGRVDWGTAAGTSLTLQDSTASGNPTSPLAPSSGLELFSTFAFALTDTDTATNITNITFTQNGTASSSDIDEIRVYLDDGTTSCVWDGSDTDLGTYSLSGSTFSASFTSGQIQTSSTTPACVHVRAGTSGTAADGKTIQFQIAGTGDVTNDQGYSFSLASGPPVAGGSATINGAATSEWRGQTNTNWGTGSNWFGPVPSSTRDCDVGLGTNVAILNVANGNCQNATFLSGGTIDWNNSTNNINVYGALDVESGFNFDNETSGPGTITMAGSSNQTLSMETAFLGSVVINNSGGAVVTVDADSTIGDDTDGSLTITNGRLRVASGVTLTVQGNITVQNGAILDIEGGGTLALGDGKTLTVESGGTLEMIGTDGSDATITWDGSGNGYSVDIQNGAVMRAQYYAFDHFGKNGSNVAISIASTASINSTYHMQDGTFTYPVQSSTTILALPLQIPGNAMDNVTFDSNGSGATTITNIDTTGAAAGTLTIATYTGDLSGQTFTTDPSYDVDWQTASNTIDVTQEAASPASANTGQTVNMGRFGFTQTQAGTFNDTDLTQIILTLTGSGNSADVDEVRIYSDSDCDSAGGTLVGTGTLSGSPETVTFNLSASDLTIAAHATTPPMNCLYVEFDIDSNAGDGNTVGVRISSDSDITDSESYGISGTTPAPITLGSPLTISAAGSTSWTGGTDSDWFTGSNWSNGVPNSTVNCNISNAPNFPEINGAASCQDLTMANGFLTILNGTGSSLDVYGNFDNGASGNFVQNDGTVTMQDAGTDQTIENRSGFTSLDFSRSTGMVNVEGNLVVTTLNMSSGNTMTITVPTNSSLTLTNGLSLPSNNTIDIEAGADLHIGSGSSISVTGGTFRTSGTNDTYGASGQSVGLKGVISNDGSGRYSFTATSGTIDLTGFIFEDLDNSGLNIGGTTTVSSLSGGQFVELSTSYASMTALQLDTTGSIPATASNVGFMWGDANSYHDEGHSPPTSSEAYTLVSSSGCGSQTITFSNWFGDFYSGVDSPDPSTKISATNCTINMTVAASPVTLTSFTASGYDEAVLLEWVTGSEISHEGFNVYRSVSPAGGFVQMNSSLIHNEINNGSAHGSYRFVDQGLTNGVTYYYKIEDVAFNGDREFHGPVNATPDAANGSVPASGGGENEGSSDPDADAGADPDTGDLENGGVEDLGGGVHVLARTDDSLKIEIIPPAAEYAVSSWNGSYETVSIAGYSKTILAGSPELPERIVFIKVDSGHTTVNLSASEVTESSTTSHNIQPAPDWVDNGSGGLMPSYSIDGAVYAQNFFSPSAYFSVDSAIHQIAGEDFIKISVWPLAFHPVNQEVKGAERIELDIGLDGQAWETDPPPADLAEYPAAVEGTLKIRFAETGMHRLTYDQMDVAGVAGPFDGVDCADFRMYVYGQEMAIQMNCAGSTFESGDSIVFYGYAFRHLEDTLSEVVLATISLGDSTGSPLRVGSIDGDPTGSIVSDEVGTYKRVEAERDTYAVFDKPLGTQVDHIMLGRPYSNNDQSVAATHVESIELPNLIQASPDPVYVTIELRGRPSIYQENPTHHVGLIVNGVQAADQVFTGDELQKIRLTVEDPSLFFAGTNSIEIEAKATFMETGDFEMIDVNRIIVEYRAHRVAEDNLANIFNLRSDESFEVYGFTSSTIDIWDVSELTEISLVSNASITTSDGGATYDAEYLGNSGPNGDHSYEYWVVADNQYKQVSQVELSVGASESLTSTSNGADLIIIGNADLLEAASDLVDARTSQGLRVKPVTPDQIYAEFSNGVKSSTGIRTFLRYAYTYWTSPKPRYVILIGDSTYDPKNGLGLDSREDLLPIPFERGSHLDIGSDNWFVTMDDEVQPFMALGRFPSSDAIVVQNYVQKILAYEDGSSAPSANVRAMKFLSGADMMNEGFAAKSTGLASAATSTWSQLSTDHVDRAMLASDAAFKTEIQSRFDQGPLLVSFFGHGAEDQFNSSASFAVSDAEALTNSRLPFVVAWNCLNALFYDADPNMVSLGESLIFNQDGGAIAFWGSGTMTDPGSQYNMANAFMVEIANEAKQTYHVVRIGDVISRTKATMGDSLGVRDTLRSWQYFGDPSMTLPEALFAEESSSGSSGGGSSSSDDSTNAQSDEGNDDGGGFLGCGRIKVDGGGSGGGWSNGAVEFAFMFLIAWIGKLVMGRRRFSYFPLSGA